MATRTMTNVRLRINPKDAVNDDVHASNNDINKSFHRTDDIIQNPDSTSHPSHQTSQSFSCFINPIEESRHLWKTPVKFFHVAARELSVLLILIETLILLGGYLMILGVHHSIRYCLSKLRNKTWVDDNVPYMHDRNYHQQARPVIPRRVPRGRMAGG